MWPAFCHPRYFWWLLAAREHSPPHHQTRDRRFPSRKRFIENTRDSYLDLFLQGECSYRRMKELSESAGDAIFHRSSVCQHFLITPIAWGTEGAADSQALKLSLYALSPPRYRGLVGAEGASTIYHSAKIIMPRGDTSRPFVKRMGGNQGVKGSGDAIGQAMVMRQVSSRGDVASRWPGFRVVPQTLNLRAFNYFFQKPRTDFLMLLLSCVTSSSSSSSRETMR